MQQLSLTSASSDLSSSTLLPLPEISNGFYKAVRQADDPDEIVLEFLQSTYEAAANLGHWDRAALEYSPIARDNMPIQSISSCVC